MHVVAEHWVLLNRPNDLRREVTWVRCREAHPPDARHTPHDRQQLGEVHARRRRIAVAVDVLPQELNLAVRLSRQALGLFEDARARAAALGTTRERHDTVGAVLVAAFDNREEGLIRVIASGEGRLEGLVGVEAQSRDAVLAGFDPFE